MRTRLWVAVLAALVVTVTACSDGSNTPSDDEPDAAATSSTATSPSEEPAVEESTPVDPCDLVSRSDWEEFIPRRALHSVEELPHLSIRYPEIYECVIGNDIMGINFAIFGYALGPFDYDAAWKSYGPNILDSTDRRRLSGIGDRAFLGVGLFESTAFAQVDDFTVSVTAFQGSTATAIAAALPGLVLQVSDAMLSHPIELPDACPTADDPALLAVVGPIEYAQGRTKRNRGTCDYGSREGTSISMSFAQYAPRAFHLAYGYAADPTVGNVLDAPPGRVRTLYVADDNSYSIETLLPDQAVDIYVSTDANDALAKPRAAGSRAAVLAFADHYARLVSRVLSQSK